MCSVQRPGALLGRATHPPAECVRVQIQNLPPDTRLCYLHQRGVAHKRPRLRRAGDNRADLTTLQLRICPWHHAAISQNRPKITSNCPDCLWTYRYGARSSSSAAQRSRDTARSNTTCTHKQSVKNGPINHKQRQIACELTAPSRCSAASRRSTGEFPSTHASVMSPSRQGSRRMP